MATTFEMDPAATRSGLNTAGVTRAAAAASPIPTPPPVDRYTAGFMTVAARLLAASTANVSSRAEHGLSAAGTSLSAVETAETSNENLLGT